MVSLYTYAIEIAEETNNVILLFPLIVILILILILILMLMLILILRLMIVKV
jgi:hypothetical protein